jgi:glycosyltransferase involved in cell wall biosynthesis
MPTETFKALHVIARFNIGGTARYLANLLPDLNSQNLDSKLAVGRVQEGEIEDSSLANLDSVRIESLGRRINLVADMRSYVSLRRIVKDYKPDVIHSHTFKAGMLCRLMYFNIPKVHTFHGHLLTDPEFSRFQKKAILVIEKILALFTRKLIVTGQQVAKDLLAEGVGRTNQYVSIPGQIQVVSALPRAIARKNLGLATEFTILWAARVAAVKNPKLLVEVAWMMPECTFIMAGDGIEMESIVSTAPENLRILGFVDVRGILSAADVFLSTSLNEGISYSILEAQSVGLPVVAVRAGALSELISDGVNGYLVASNPIEIVEKIRNIQTNPQLHRSMKVKAKEGVMPELESYSFTQSHLDVYREILGKINEIGKDRKDLES